MDEGFLFDDFSVETESFEYMQIKKFDRIFRVGEGGSILQHPLVHDGIVYVGAMDRNVYAINIENGELVWKFTAEGGFLPSSPVIGEGMLFIGSYDQNLYALDPKTGKLIWKFRTQEKVTATPTVLEGKVFVGSNDYNMYCIDAKTGQIIWKFHTQGEIPSMATPYKDMILFGSYDRFLYCIRRDDGTLVWKHEAQSDIFNEWYLLIHENVVYSPCTDNILRAIDVNTGRLIWKFTTGIYGGMHSSPILHNGKIFVVNREGNLFSMTLDSKVVWKYTINHVMSLISIDEDKIYFGAGDQNLHCVGMDGKDLWKFPTQGEIWWKPAIQGNKIFFTSHDCNLYCIDKNTHDLIWKFRAQGAPSEWPPPFDHFELSVNKTIEDSDVLEEPRRKSYDLGALEEETPDFYKSRITYQISTQYSAKGKYQKDSSEEEF